MFQQLKIFHGAPRTRPYLGRGRILAAVALFAAAGWLASAQRVPAADEPAPGGASSAGKAERAKFLKSESWRNTMGGLDEWFSAQPMYDQGQVGEIKQRLSARLDKMSTDELEDFQQDLDAKLEMTLSPAGRSILGWVTANLEAAAPAYRKKMDLRYPDVIQLTAAQLRAQLDALEEKRSAARNRTTALEQSRQARITALKADQSEQNADRERALDRASASAGAAGYRSHYFPGSSVRQYRDQIGPPVYGYGFGFW